MVGIAFKLKLINLRMNTRAKTVSLRFTEMNFQHQFKNKFFIVKVLFEGFQMKRSGERKTGKNGPHFAYKTFPEN